MFAGRTTIIPATSNGKRSRSKVDVGYHKGSTLGDIALRKPGDLEWYVKHYSGRNLPLKAGAILLVDAARKMAS